ncbi:hypothetical protein L4X63_20395 [Geomonas sp. Red32]|uniref:hypothetical protein n=1 Tax=Geomonas sp. Red32 TaxID=2912856 RepID=UPI00202CB20B|nr:hypothetical protein [Geomonas sp. Red32]MCM0083946.1 hypothetical protein [Geomonas sp. Red32]
MVLARSADDLMTDLSELVSSSAQTAASVSETGTVQEVRQTTDLTSQKSRQVCALFRPVALRFGSRGRGAFLRDGE